MSIYDRIRNDSERFLAGEDMQDVTLYNASGVSKSAKARVNTVASKMTQQGLIHITQVNSIGFNIDAFSDITGSDETYEKWQGEFLNSQGETVKGLFNDIQIDKTINYVSANLTNIKTVTP